MVRKRGEFAYKCSEVNSSKVIYSNVHKRTIKYNNSLADRQKDISFENLEYTQQRTLAHQQVRLELPSQQMNCTVFRVPSQCSKCTCRLKVKDNLEWKLDLSVFQEIATHMGEPTLDLFASRLCHQFPDILHGNQTSAV